MGVGTRIAVAGLSVLLAAALVRAQGHADVSEPYVPPPQTNDALDDPMSQLARAMAAGDVQLAFSPLLGYLPALLGALDIPASSQVLVFSKTSLQHDVITPRTPRAIYFNDSVYVGYVPGRAVEGGTVGGG